MKTIWEIIIHAMIIALLVISVLLCAGLRGAAERASTSSKSDNMDVILENTSDDGRTNYYKYSGSDYYYEYSITTSSEGTYFFFSTRYEEAYVEFLERLDKDKYEIIDRSVQAPTFKVDAFYMITYTKKPNEAQQN